VGAGAGGTLGYAAYDPKFRADLQDTIPGSDQALDLILGPLPAPPPPPPKPSEKTLSKLKIPSSIVVTPPKPEVEEKPAVVAPIEEPAPLVPAPPLEPPPPPVEEIAPEPVPEVPVEIEVKAEAIIEPKTIEPVIETVIVDEPVEEAKLDEPVAEVAQVEEPVVTTATIEEPVVELKAVKVVESEPDLPEKVEELPKIETIVVADEVKQVVEPTPTLESARTDIEVPIVEKEVLIDLPSADVQAPESEVKSIELEAAIVEPEMAAIVEPEVAAVEAIPEVVEAIPAEAAAAADSEPATVEVIVAIEPETLIEEDLENLALNAILGEMLKDMKASVEKAVAGYETSTESVMNHVALMHQVLESDVAVTDNSAWNQLYEAALNKSDAAKAAEIREKEAIAAIDNVIETISSGRKRDETAANPELKSAEESVNKAIYHLDQAKVKGAALEKEARVMEEYRNLVDLGRKQFHREMASIMPDVKLGEQTGKLTEDELNMFISHAYRKVLFLQKQLARQQTVEQEAFKKAVQQHRAEVGAEAAVRVAAEVSEARLELEKEARERLEQIQADAEQELRSQLRRQAAAHSDHIQDVLKIREDELGRVHSKELSDKTGELSLEYNQSLAALAGSVAGLREALEARAANDKACGHTMTLWAAVAGLKSELDSVSGPLGPEVAKVLSIAGEGDTFVSSILASLSSTALERGVYTQENLLDRFDRVHSVARKVANIGDEGGSLLKYAFSYLQSLILLDTPTTSVNASESSLSSLHPRDVLSLAKQHLERGDLPTAVQLTNSLQGEPGRVCADWLSEAVLTLETRQLVDLLITHAEATSLETLPSN